ncbi:MAG: signal peptidase II [Dorea sp.]|nr:signal peptidase II [Dorea sp.]MDY2812936.1 signal peptidase II [Dorea sp.]
MNTEKKRYIHYLTAAITAILLVVLDQITKYLAVIHLKDQPPYVILQNIFQLEYLENRGAAFGLFQDKRIFFYLSVILISVIVVWFYSRVPMDRKYMPLRICAVLLIAGAYGNFIDRIRLNYVIDFFYFKLIDFPIFNVADIYVTVSSFLIILLIFFYYKEDDLERILHR